MPHRHAVVWIDYHEARIFKFNAEDAEKGRIKADTPSHQIHTKAGNIGAGHAHDSKQFFHSVVEAIADMDEWLVVGPAAAKTELVKHIETHDPRMRERLIGVEPMDHPTDGELLKHARRFFDAADKLRGTKALP